MRAPRGSLTAIVAFVTALAVAQPVSAITGWPQEGHDSGHSHANTQEWRLRPRNVGTLRLLWSRSIRTADEGWIYEHIDVPVVRDAVYAWWLGEGVETPRSVALSVDTGQTIWQRSREWGVAAASADTVYANAGPWRVVALDAAGGERRWARWGMRVFAASPSIDRLVVRTRDGVGVIEASTGRDVWIRDGIVIDGHPLMSRGVIVARADQAPDAILGLDAETGDTLWERPLRRRHGGWNSSYPEAAAAGLVYVVARWSPDDHSTIRALRLDDGSTVWRQVLPGDIPRVAAVGGGRLFVTRNRCATPGGCIGGDWERYRGALLALDADTGRTIWMLHGVAGTARPLWGAGALANGLVFASGVRRWPSFGLSRVVAISAATGRIRWTTDIRRAFAYVSAVADGQVYVTTAGGIRGGRVRAYGLA